MHFLLASFSVTPKTLSVLVWRLPFSRRLYVCVFIWVHFRERFHIDAVSPKMVSVLVWTEGLNSLKCTRFQTWKRTSVDRTLHTLKPLENKPLGCRTFRTYRARSCEAHPASLPAGTFTTFSQKCLTGHKQSFQIKANFSCCVRLHGTTTMLALVA